MFDHPLGHLGWRPELQDHLDPSLTSARVIAVDRAHATVDDGSTTRSAPLAGRLRRADAMPAVGDFVGVVPDGPVRSVLPRRGVIARRREIGGTQILAANVDLALLATSANRDLNPRRIARFLSLTARGGVRAVVLLTKSDLVDDPEPMLDLLRDAGDDIEALAVSPRTGAGVEAVRALLGPALTAVLLGTSGVGKSTLTNLLLGEERQATNTIREDDDRGRHTTVKRELITLPDGALLIDTPGVRSVAPVEDADEITPPVPDKKAVKRAKRELRRKAQKEARRDLDARRAAGLKPPR